MKHRHILNFNQQRKILMNYSALGSRSEFYSRVILDRNQNQFVTEEFDRIQLRATIQHGILNVQNGQDFLDTQ